MSSLIRHFLQVQVAGSNNESVHAHLSDIQDFWCFLVSLHKPDTRRNVSQICPFFFFLQPNLSGKELYEPSERAGSFKKLGSVSKPSVYHPQVYNSEFNCHFSHLVPTLSFLLVKGATLDMSCCPLASHKSCSVGLNSQK